MAAWTLVPCLVSLRNEFNELAPHRDKASDGSIGNLAHQQESSDHNPDETGRTPSSDADKVNEVHAIDVDNDFHEPGWTMDRAVQIIVTRHREGRDDRLQNVIWNRRIWSRSWGWTARAYNGASAHTEHAHFSARYTTAQEQDTRPWGLLADHLEDDMDVADLDTKTAQTAITRAVIAGMQAATLGGTYGKRTFAGSLNVAASEAIAAPLRDAAILKAVQGVDEEAVLARVDQLAAQMTAGLQALPDAVAAELAGLGGLDAALVQAAVERALSRLQLVVADAPSPGV
jgi:hypothetical protein